MEDFGSVALSPGYHDKHYLDDAVWGVFPTPVWQNLIYPAGPDSGKSLDLAFVLNHKIISAVEFELGEPPAPSRLEQNYPNPFNPVTTIRYELPEASYVVLAIFNIKGERIRVLVDEPMPAGSHATTWDGTNASGVDVASGVYFYRMQAGNTVQAKRLVLLK